MRNTYKLKGEVQTKFRYKLGGIWVDEVKVGDKRYYLYKTIQFKRDAEVIAKNLRKIGWNAVVRGAKGQDWSVYRRHKGG